MKKLLTAALVLIAVFCGILGFAACEEQPASLHEHTYGEWTTVKPATCLEKGLRERTCSECNGKETEAIPVDPEAHVFDEGEIAIVPTCATEGKKVLTCTACKKTKTETLPADPDTHVWNDGVIVSAPTCSATGEKLFTCKYNDTHTKTEILEKDPNVHRWDDGTETKEATCCEKGVMTFTCLDCKTATRNADIEIDEENHLWDDGTQTLAPTCSAVGEKTYYCQRNRQHTRTEEVEIDKTAHRWNDGSVTKKATCLEEGTKFFLCELCFETRTDTIPVDKVDGHKWDSGMFTTPMDCKHDGVKHYTCELCKDVKDETVKSDPEAHIWGTRTPNNDGTHDRTCTVDGCGVEEQATDCVYEDIFHAATCTENAYTTHTCTFCGYQAPDTVQEHSAIGHNYQESPWISDDAGHHYRVCLNEPTNEDHRDVKECSSYSTEDKLPADCETDGYLKHYCSVCYYQIDFEKLEQTGHDFEGEGRTVDSLKTGEHILHCAHNPAHILQQPCSYEAGEPVKPTCTAQGYTVKTCSVCQYSYNDDFKEELGHDWKGDYTTVVGDGPVDPTADGRHYQTCSRCDERNEEPCGYGANGAVTEPTCSAKGYTTYTCEKCGSEKKGNFTEMIAHTLVYTSNHDGTHNAQCVYCKGAHGDALTNVSCEETMTPGKPVAATCTAKGYTVYTCSLCNYDEQRDEKDIIPHSYDNKWSPVADEPGSHSRSCNVCGNVETQLCGFDEGKVTKPTCTAQGFTTYTCNDCGYTKTEDQTSASGHSYDENGWKPVDPYSEQNKRHYRVCTVCSEGREEEACTEFEFHTENSSCFKKGHRDTVCDKCSGTTTEELELIAHTWGNYEIDGEKGHYRKCKIDGCDGREETEGHTLKPTGDLPTCTGVGANDEMCEFCGYVKDGQDIPALGHKYTEGKWEYDEGDTTRHYRTCTVCGTKDYHDCVKDVTTQDPTCTKNKTLTYTCTDCKRVEVQELPETALGHDYGNATPNGDHIHHTLTCIRPDCDAPGNNTRVDSCEHSDNPIQPTCTSAGKHVLTCSVCNDTFDGDPIEKLAHNYPSTWTNESNGKHYHTCTYGCGEREEEPCQDSTKVVPSTCTVRGYTLHSCSKCNNTYKTNYQELKAHRFDNTWTKSTNGKTHSHRCLDCKQTFSENCSISLLKETPATCTQPAQRTYTCKTCGYVSQPQSYGTAAGHRWVFETKTTQPGENSTHGMRCSVCSTRQQQPCEYDEVEVPATCTQNKYHIHTCTICNGEYRHEYQGTMREHTYSVWTSEGVGTKRHSSSCTVCGNRTTRGCTDVQKTASVPVSCTADGYDTYTCNDCRGTYTVSTGTATGHDLNWRSWGQSPDGVSHFHRCGVCGLTETKPCVFTYTSQPATCYEKGWEQKYCPTCIRTVRTVLPKLEHTFRDSDWKPVEGQPGRHTRSCCNGCGLKQTSACVMVDAGSSAATCTDPGFIGKVCNLCGYSTRQDVQPLQHSWSSWQPSGDDQNHERHCLNPSCGQVEKEPCTLHTERTDLSCLTPASTKTSCDRCGYYKEVIETPAPGHSWRIKSSSEASHDAICERCAKEEDNLKHDYSETNICSVCGYDGLKYELVGEDHYMVLNDNNVSSAKHIVIPAEYNHKPVLEIAADAFISNRSMETVVLPRCLQSIANLAFVDCRTLRSVTFAEGDSEIELRSIGLHAFFDCRSLSSFPFALCEKLTTIGDSCFAQCRQLNEIDLPDSLTNIGSGAFTGTGLYNSRDKWEGQALYLDCHLIKVDENFEGTFTIKPNTVSVAMEAFKGCTKLTGIVIPVSVTFFDKDAFAGCEQLATLEYKGNLEQWLKIKFANDLASPLNFVKEFHIANVENNPKLPDNITEIPAGTFRGNKSLITITIPEGVTSIGAYAFADCSNLATIVIPETVTYIGEHAFDGCTALIADESNWDSGVFYVGKHAVMSDDEKIQQAGGDITLRDGTISIVARAFMGKKNLHRVVIPDTVVWIGEQAFADSGLTAAKFEGAANNKTDGVRFFCNGYTMPIGRWMDEDLYNEQQAAGLITGLYQGYWRRTRAAKKSG